MLKELIDIIREKLKGKKTYSVVIAAVTIAILQATGVLPPELPRWVWMLLSALGLGGAKAKLDRSNKEY